MKLIKMLITQELAAKVTHYGSALLAPAKSRIVVVLYHIFTSCKGGIVKLAVAQFVLAFCLNKLFPAGLRLASKENRNPERSRTWAPT